MSRISLFLFAGIILVFVISLALIFRPAAAPQRTTSEVVQLAPQENSGGEVDVKVTPKVLVVGEKPQLELEFNTHSVELDFDIEAISDLTDDQGNSYGKPVWDGSPPEGHHRRGALTFPETLGDAKSVSLTLKDINGVTSREFSWQL